MLNRDLTRSLVLVFPQFGPCKISGLFRGGGCRPRASSRKRKSLQGRRQWFGSKGTRKEMNRAVSGANTEQGAII